MSLKNIVGVGCLGLLSWLNASEKIPEFSTAGFFVDSTITTEREVLSMNVGWRFHRGEIADNANGARADGEKIPAAAAVDFADKDWAVVNLPHGIEYLPLNASGGVNYQGVVWYRKHFTPPANLAHKKLFLYFEAVMGKCKVFVNGKEVAQHFGGYLPFSVDLTGLLKFAQDNVIAVMVDNADDATYPPGKPQANLDYTYCGGIYRDVYLIATNAIYITDANYENEVAGGGVFIASENVTAEQATLNIKTTVKNSGDQMAEISLAYQIIAPDQQIITHATAPQKINPQQTAIFAEKIAVAQPQLWSPQQPNLYAVKIAVKQVNNAGGKVVDGYRQRVGIRALEFKGEQGFFLNGKPYNRPLIGGNRHHDFAVIGNALPNSLHWRDAKKMKAAGMEVVRNAHCPQDPAFLEACDELGLFVINNNPGWQFWNDKDKIFGERVCEDIRQLVRRDRNHPCILFWEPVLNETYFPESEAEKWNAIVYAEFPAPYCYTANDFNARGAKHFPILYPHPVARPANQGGEKIHQVEKPLADKAYFTREWGDCVDNWNAQNSPSRVYIGWGENAQLIQAKHYAKPDYPVTCFNSLFSLPPQYVGGALWHTFDHQRGYHSDPFYGGIYDAFRQPKYSAQMFKSQRDPQLYAPFIFIAHEMTPFSPRDVTVYSNCDNVKLTAIYTPENTQVYEYTRDKNLDQPQKGMRFPIITFKDAYRFWDDKTSGNNNQPNVQLQAEGFIDGKLVATHIVKPARRPTKLRLFLDDENVALRADGSDMVTVVAELTDDAGNVKRLNAESVQFAIAGEGRLIGDATIGANPKPLVWGQAPILVQATNTAGEITVTASMSFGGKNKPLSATLKFNSIPAALAQLFNADEMAAMNATTHNVTAPLAAPATISAEERQKIATEMKKVEKQQAEFGEQNAK